MYKCLLKIKNIVYIIMNRFDSNSEATKLAHNIETLHELIE